MKKTRIIKVNPENPEEDRIMAGAEIIKNGGLVAFPTETVYGLGANALDRKAVLGIYKAKERPADNPLIVHVCNKDMIEDIAELNDVAEKLIKRFFPGPLTVVVKKKECIPQEVTAGLDTVAIRMPDNKVALKLIELSEVPISAPSANLAGKPSPTKAEHVIEDLYGRIDAILDGGPTNIGLESTVVDTTVYPVELLRPGGLSVEELEKVVDIKIPELDEGIPRSPGMKYRHYAPSAELIVIYGKREDVVSKIIKTAGQLIDKSNKKIGLVVSDSEPYKDIDVEIVEIGRSVEEVARNLFSALRELDRRGIDLIIAEGVEEKGLGLAVMNRLKKASNYRIFRV
ncbi:translation factor SUA5 [Archaeoglobus sulfaticallidus PM70-1]|uniref:Threonylcarbamoyl-AMP synthase n=1 Tax=Archaeoglobus sulfaticallidus PM70-1 TaxID=387631 RepID=N0BJQ0_9EURY|nr:L-threonylcarbamoyladenylate synthase [Archaeoglobus sulfaticallidus]AGK60726.1 translation factor SUA5 [Archaeoglobus sulfaticallidus PM70-1]